jgi:hypothetical protein
MKNIRKEIKETVMGWPNWEVSTGLLVDKVGNKYVRIINCWGNGSNFKITLDDFYHTFILRDKEIDDCTYIY